jgi:hypothetical protein
MQRGPLLAVLLKLIFLPYVLLQTACGARRETSPIRNVIAMIHKLHAKVSDQRNEASRAYDKQVDWCQERSRAFALEVKTGRADVENLKATIENELASTGALEAAIENVATDISKDDADLKAAVAIRTKEALNFAKEEKELEETIGMLMQGLATLSQEKRQGMAFLRYDSSTSLTSALGTLIQSSMLSEVNASRLVALTQASSNEDNSQSIFDAAFLDSSSATRKAASNVDPGGAILDTLNDLFEKGKARLDAARRTEANNKHNFELLRQSLTSEIDIAKVRLNKAKQELAASRERKSIAEGDLEAVSLDLEADVASQKVLKHDCMSAATEYEIVSRSRVQESEALATAMRVLKECIEGAGALQYAFWQKGSPREKVQISMSALSEESADLQQEMKQAGIRRVSLLQLGSQTQASVRLASSSDLAKFEAVRFIRDLARKLASPVLTQLASKMDSAMRLGLGQDEDPLAGIKGLLVNMLDALRAESEQDKTQTSFCDGQLSEATSKKEDLDTEKGKLTIKLAQAGSRHKKLEEEVALLHEEIAAMSRAKGAADTMRSEEEARNKRNRAEIQKGIKGIQLAIQVLQEYYSSGNENGSNQGAGSSIVSLLEACELDFTNSLQAADQEEHDAAAAYAELTHTNQLLFASKQEDVKHRMRSAAGIRNDMAGVSADLSSVSARLGTAVSSLEDLKKMCTSSDEPHIQRRARRVKEISGLREALEMIVSDAFVQRSAKRTLLVRRVVSNRTSHIVNQ